MNHPIFEQGDTKKLSIEFTVVNDSDKGVTRCPLR